MRDKTAPRDHWSRGAVFNAAGSWDRRLNGERRPPAPGPLPKAETGTGGVTVSGETAADGQVRGGDVAPAAGMPRRRRAYLPLKCFSLRFSKNAPMPSSLSSVPQQTPKASASKAEPV